MSNKIIITGTGCALADFVYNNIAFNSHEFQKYSSKKPGDGGLSPGRLVFTEELENFAGKPYPEIIAEITGNKTPETFNIGGPSLVSLIHAAQVLTDNTFEVRFYGISGQDETAGKIRQLLKKTPVDMAYFLPHSSKPTPFTHVLSDPSFDNGHGERTFINNIGAAWDLTPDLLPDSFFESDIVCFGGTALTPKLHDNLHYLLKTAKQNNCFTVVNTVYDFRSEKQNPGKPWPLGETELSFPNIDLLIMDNEEALKISGKDAIPEVLEFYVSKTNAFVITRGSAPVFCYSSGKLFSPESGELPVSKAVTSKLQSGAIQTGDTTGCGDNFTGGVIASIAEQLLSGKQKLNLREAVVSGICAGGFTCFYAGGTYFEKSAGEKKQEIRKLISAYREQ